MEGAEWALKGGKFKWNPLEEGGGKEGLSSKVQVLNSKFEGGGGD